MVMSVVLVVVSVVLLTMVLQGQVVQADQTVIQQVATALVVAVAVAVEPNLDLHLEEMAAQVKLTIDL